MLPVQTTAKKAFIKTYGCQMNEQDSLHMRGLLRQMGYGWASDPMDADLILYSTCSIREKAVHKVYSDLGRVRPLVEADPSRIVGLAGCVAQQEKERLFQRFPFLDLVFGPDAIRQLPQMVGEVEARKQQNQSTRVLATRFNQRDDFEFINLIDRAGENPFKAFVNIQKGCDNVCSFCIVPHVRGPEVSRPHQDILREVTELVALGVQDVTLLGQNVNSYGWKTPGEPSFANLLRLIACETGIERLRFTTSHPQDVGDDLVNCFHDLPNLCSNFHLPVQSGSDRILTQMRRYYSIAHYLEIVRQLRAAHPEIALTTDFIVGFPGETEADFQLTLDLLKEVRFDTSFSFLYSPRPKTSAIHLKDDVPQAVKSERLQRLQRLQQQISGEVNCALEGKREVVMVDAMDDSGLNWIGRTSSNKIVHIRSRPQYGNLLGKLIPVKIMKGNPNSLIGDYDE